MKCPNCNKEIDHDSKFCASCGKGIIKDDKEAEKEKGKTKTRKSCVPGCIKGCIGWCGGFLITAVVIISAIYVAYKHPFNLFKVSDKDIENAITQQSNEMNKTLPIKVDEVTDLVNTTTSGKEFTYFYKVKGNSNLSQNDLDKLVKSKIVNQACFIYSDTKKLLNDGIILTYIYNDTSGKYIGKLSIQKSDCK
jgi:uncharacterized membrane protein YvbJ